MYGHLDKQPEMSGWRPGLSAWSPVREGNRLYGRGGADDGYAVFASLAAIRALEDESVSHARVVVLIEFSEESGSPDLPAYMEDFSSVNDQAACHIFDHFIAEDERQPLRDNSATIVRQSEHQNALVSAGSIASCVGESEILGDQEPLCRLDSRPQVVILRALQALAHDSVDVMA